MNIDWLCETVDHGLLHHKVQLTLKIRSVDSDAQDINWQSVFNHVRKRSSAFEPGEALPKGCIFDSLQSITSVSNNATAERILQQAIWAKELRETADGYKVAHEGPSTGEIGRRLDNRLREIMQGDESGVIQSPTSSGKTYISSTTQWRNHPQVTGGQPVIVLSGTKDARSDALAKTQQSQASAEVLLGRYDACPLARGDYDSDNREGNTPISAPDGSEPSEWFSTLCDERGLYISIAHGIFERAYDGNLPCCEDGDCLSKTQWTDVPRDDDEEFDFDVLHATHSFAQVPQLIKNCNLIIDERPDFGLDMSTGRLRQIVMSYLDEIDAPVTKWAELLVRLTGSFDGGLEAVQDAWVMPEKDWFLHNKEAHALGPGIVKALITAEEQSHGRWVGRADYTYPTLNPNHDAPTQEVTIRIVLEGDESNNLRILQAIPDFSKARSVIGLDAYPTMPKWRGNTLPDIEKEKIVNSEELHKWRRNQRNLKIIQVGDNKHSWTNEGFNDSKVRVLCHELREKFGSGIRTGITSLEFEDDLKDILSDVCAEDPETIHYNNQKSVEDFDSEQAGIVAGCISPSSDQTKDWLALLGKAAVPKREVDDDYEGQMWVGPDAYIAKELLADIREKGVLQACGRYARSPRKPDDGANVYVLTNVLPEEYVDEEVDDVNVLKTKARQILNYISTSSEGIAPSEICENIDVSRKYVHDILNKSRTYSWMEVEKKAGSNDPDLYYMDRCPTGLVKV